MNIMLWIGGLEGIYKEENNVDSKMGGKTL